MAFSAAGPNRTGLGTMMTVFDTSEFVALETKVWVALQTGDSAADLSALSENFLGVYPSGFSNRSDHVGQLADGPTIAEYSIVDARVLAITDRDVMLAYRADFRRPGSASELESMFVSSLWSLRDGRWLNVFSQDTPAVAPEIPIA